MSRTARMHELISKVFKFTIRIKNLVLTKHVCPAKFKTVANARERKTRAAQAVYEIVKKEIAAT